MQLGYQKRENLCVLERKIRAPGALSYRYLQSEMGQFTHLNTKYFEVLLASCAVLLLVPAKVGASGFSSFD
jgi:hypothetical protein